MCRGGTARAGPLRPAPPRRPVPQDRTHRQRPPYQRGPSAPARACRGFPHVPSDARLTVRRPGLTPPGTHNPHIRKEPGMTPSQLPVGLRTQQTLAAYYRAGYPIEEIADAIGTAASTCEDLIEAMRGAGWTLRRPRGAHEHVQIDNAFLRERYLRRRWLAARGRERLSLSGLARAAGMVRPGHEPDPTWIG